MEIDILEKKENKVLDRTEIKFNCLYEGEATPQLLNVKNKLVALLNTKKEFIVVDSIQPHFGEAKAAGYAKVYDSENSLKDIETKHVLDKNQEAKVPAEEEEIENNIEEKPTEEESSEESSTEEESDEEKPTEEE
jgi:small subunit ribosomal protein S24e